MGDRRIYVLTKNWAFILNCAKIVQHGVPVPKKAGQNRCPSLSDAAL
jgi:hypothetical protein